MYENLLQVLLYQGVVTGVCTNHKKKMNKAKIVNQSLNKHKKGIKEK